MAKEKDDKKEDKTEAPKRVTVVGTRIPNVFSSEGRIRYGETVDVLAEEAEGLMGSHSVAKPDTKVAKEAKAAFDAKYPAHKSEAE